MKTKILSLFLLIFSLYGSSQNIEFLEQPIYLNNPIIPRATLLIDLRPGQLEITRPLIIAEGFDAGSVISPEEEYGDTDLISFDRSINNSGNNLRNLVDPTNNNQAYDIIYVNWTNGTDAIQENALVLREVINWVNTNKIGTEPNVLLGQSMGGIIGRYTLANMEADGETHDVRLFVAHDSPMQGANTPLSLQYFSRHAYDQYTSSPVLYGLVEVVIPTVLNLIELMSFGNLDIAFPSVSDVLTLQDTPAAMQMNYHYVDYNSDPTMAIHDAWQQEFENAGYPSQSRNIAISNGNECAVDHGFDPRDKFIDLHDTHNPDVWGDLVHLVATPLAGIITTDIELVFLGLLPGSSKYFFDFDLHANPDINQSTRRVYRGKIRYEKKLLKKPNHFNQIIDKMIELKEQENLLINNFIELLESKLSIIKPSKKLQNWNLLDFGSLLKEFKKLKVKLSLEEEAEWMQYFKGQKQKAEIIKTEIDKTERQIDQMVYELYSLSENEIKIVENANA